MIALCITTQYIYSYMSMTNAPSSCREHRRRRRRHPFSHVPLYIPKDHAEDNAGGPNVSTDIVS